MRRVYCGKVGIEYRFISNPRRKGMDPPEGRRPPEPLPAELRKQILEQLVAAETFERFLGTRFLGQRRTPSRGRRRPSPSSTSSSRAPAARGRRGLDRPDPPRPAEHPRERRRQLRGADLRGLRGAPCIPDFPADEGDVKYHQGAARPARPRAAARSRSPFPRTRRTSRPSIRWSRARAGQAGPARGSPRGGVVQGLARAPPRRRGVRRPGHRRGGLQPRAAARATGPAGRSISSSTTRSASRPNPAPGRSSLYRPTSRR